MIPSSESDQRSQIRVGGGGGGGGGRGAYNNCVEEWQNTMKEALQITESNSAKKRKSNEDSYNKRLYGNDVEVGDRVLLRNFEKGVTGKLRSHWENRMSLKRKVRRFPCSPYPRKRGDIKRKRCTETT